ncbi:hypothetical protein [Acidianus ambivalens]|uniref:Uncharacterized protein n=1 Tax=Acidianus ambivalens TaxID=2283 RepID=A0A650CWX8_ACIAM|nr:hypothetical protein [Acidianus ambivalens]MQL54582.1 hypothetical protein [Acidianus ambivalens]QGR22389.1 hypothetical protein D1866_10700 [Acidianus ambivalens]
MHIEKFKNSKVQIWDFGDFIIVSPHNNLNEIRGSENTDQLLELLVNLAFIYIDKKQINDICKIRSLHIGEGDCDDQMWNRFLQYADIKLEDKNINDAQLYEIILCLVGLIGQYMRGEFHDEYAYEKAVKMLKRALTCNDKNFRTTSVGRS